MTRAERVVLAKRRLRNVLRNHVVATERTLEQKISDAGPSNQRIEPMVLTPARRELVDAGVVVPLLRDHTPWYHLADTPVERVEVRLKEMEPVYSLTQQGDFKARLGQMLEIAVYKALLGSGQVFLGEFIDLDKHDDSKQYKKVEPPLRVSGKMIEKGPLDFIVAQTECLAGMEIKNYRNWLYPDSAAVKELLWKCSDLDAVPVLIARRIRFITFRLLNLSGGLVHQNYNQLYPKADAELAKKTADKNLLGYHDLRLGSDPDKRMLNFVCRDLPVLKEKAKLQFAQFREMHGLYGKGDISYKEWVREILTQRGIWSQYGSNDKGKEPFYDIDPSE